VGLFNLKLNIYLSLLPPLILNGPVTKRSPDLSYLRKTTLCPLNLPAKRMTTDPGTILFLSG